MYGDYIQLGSAGTGRLGAKGPAGPVGLVWDSLEGIDLLRTVVLGLVLVVALTGCAGGSDAGADGEKIADVGQASDRADSPEPPRIPDDFTWTGRYAVPDLDLEVPFTWQGRDGDFQMVAGGKKHPIHFTNVIHEGQLYTLTYRWPDVPRQACSHVGAFTLDALNEGFAEASFAGRETLHRGDADLEVNHFRSVGVIDLPPGMIEGMEEGLPLRIPLMAGDIYVDAEDGSKLRQLLHFGLQNLYDPNLDEWILIDEIDDAPGKVSLPGECVESAAG